MTKLWKLLSGAVLCAAIVCAAAGCGGGNGNNGGGNGNVVVPPVVDDPGEQETPPEKTDPGMPDHIPVFESNADWYEDKALKVLMLGTSFSEDAIEYLYELAKSKGIEKVVVANLNNGSSNVEKHYKQAVNDSPVYTYQLRRGEKWEIIGNYRISAAVRSENWDFITLQNLSSDAGKPETYAYLPQLVAWVKANAPANVKLGWQMTWSSENWYAAQKETVDEAYESIAKAVPVNVFGKNPEITIHIPNGTAIQNARTSFAKDCLTRDGHHLSFGLGRYIAGLTLFKALTGLPIDRDIFVPCSLSETERLLAVECAENALKTPYKVTESIYKAAPDAK